VPKFRDRQLHAFVALLVAMVASLMVFPLLLPEGTHRSAGRFMMFAILLLALWAAGIRPRTVLLLVPVLIAYFVFKLDAPTSFLVVGIRAVFFGYATVAVVMHTLRAEKVTGDTIAGAACARSGCAAAKPASGESPSAAPTPRWQNGVKRLR